jgi:polysaccharide export outer membrane protein
MIWAGLALLLQAASVVPTPPAPETLGGYLIGPKDVVEIHVAEIPELNVDRRVSDGGTIDLPMIGEFPVSGLDASALRGRLEKLLTEKYVNRASVSVSIKEFANKPISILGAVKTPGFLRISGRWSLLQAISAAGGLTETAGRKIIVLRRQDKDQETIEIDVDDVLRGPTEAADLVLLPGDVVNVPARRPVKVFLLGEVKTAGALEFYTEERFTLLSAIAKAGGLTDRASPTIRIRRRGKGGHDDEIVANFRRILSGRDPDVALQADDVILVKESFF